VTLPTGWVESSIGNVCELANGMAFKPTDWAKTGLPIIRIQNLNRPDADFNYCDREVDDRFLVEPGELLFAWSGTPGTSFGAHVWTGERAVLNQHIFRVRFSHDVLDKTFFKLAINAKLEELIGKAHGGVGLRHVTKGKFEETEIGVPPLAEQRRIVAKLDTLTARLRRARTELDRVAAMAKAMRTAAVEAKFSYGATTAGGWNEESLGSILTEGPSNGWSPPSDVAATGALSLKLTATTSGRLRLDPAAVKRIHHFPPPTSRYWLSPGDLLVQRANALEHVGATAIFDGPENTYIYPDLMMRLRFARPEITRLVWYYLNSSTARSYFRTRATGTAGNMPKINGATIRELRIRLPPASQSRAVVEDLDTAFARADRLEAEAARARALLDRLEAAILARAFRGDLVPQDPTDEPATTLLNRIREARAATPKPKRGRRAMADADSNLYRE
jgi:type I restriction enzyme, S subunit